MEGEIFCCPYRNHCNDPSKMYCSKKTEVYRLPENLVSMHHEQQKTDKPSIFMIQSETTRFCLNNLLVVLAREIENAINVDKLWEVVLGGHNELKIGGGQSYFKGGETKFKSG